jgi:hypothetical protein
MPPDLVSRIARACHASFLLPQLTSTRATLLVDPLKVTTLPPTTAPQLQCPSARTASPTRELLRKIHARELHVAGSRSAPENRSTPPTRATDAAPSPRHRRHQVDDADGALSADRARARDPREDALDAALARRPLPRDISIVHIGRPGVRPEEDTLRRSRGAQLPDPCRCSSPSEVRPCEARPSRQDAPSHISARSAAARCGRRRHEQELPGSRLAPPAAHPAWPASRGPLDPARRRPPSPLAIAGPSPHAVGLRAPRPVLEAVRLRPKRPGSRLGHRALPMHCRHACGPRAASSFGSENSSGTASVLPDGGPQAVDVASRSRCARPAAVHNACARATDPHP